MTTKETKPKKDAKTEAMEKVKKTLAADENIIELRPDTIKNYICPKATPQEISMFLNTCSMFDLNPFKKEIYLIKYGNYAATTVVGYQAYLKRAERSGKWAGIASGIKEGTKGDDLTAWAKAWRTDWKEPAYVEVDYSEYVQKSGSGDPNKFWKEKPKTMLKKVAVSQVLRLAFPDETASLPYTMFEENIEEKAMGEIIDAEVVEDEKPEEKEKPKAKPKPKPEAKEPDRPLELTEEDNPVFQKEKEEKKEEAPEPEPEPEQQALAEEPEEADPLTPEKNGINQKLDLLFAPTDGTPPGYGRDKKHLLKKIHGALKDKFGSVRAEIPDDLNKAECDFLLRILQLTIEEEEKKKRAKGSAL